MPLPEVPIWNPRLAMQGPMSGTGYTPMVPNVPQVPQQAAQARMQGGGFRDTLRDLAPTLLALGPQMMTSRNPDYSVIGKAVSDMRQRRSTADWLRQNRPEYADAYAAGVLDPKTIGSLMFGQAELPNSVREYQFAQRQGFDGSYLDFELAQKKAGATNVTVGGGKYGTIPPGYELVEGPNGASMRPIPGGPAAQEAAKAAEVEGARQDSRTTKSDVITQAADKARALIGRTTTGTPGRMIAGALTESDAAELRRQVGVMTATATIENLNAMRRQSPTGGALGNVTEREGMMLAAAAGALDPDAGPAQFAEALDNYERTLLRIIHGPQRGDEIFAERAAARRAGGGGDGSTSTNVPYKVLD